MNKASVLVLALLQPFFCLATWEDEVSLGTPVYNGSGCPEGAASAQISPDAKELSLSFSQFKAEAGVQSGINLDRKICDISVPISMPAGYTVSVNQIDYRGSISLPQGSYTKLKAKYSFANEEGPSFEKRWDGELNENFLLSQEVPSSSLVWSNCGGDTTISAKLGMMLRSAENSPSSTTLNGNEDKGGIVFNLQWRRCRD